MNDRPVAAGISDRGLCTYCGWSAAGRAQQSVFQHLLEHWTTDMEKMFNLVEALVERMDAATTKLEALTGRPARP